MRAFLGYTRKIYDIKKTLLMTCIVTLFLSSLDYMDRCCYSFTHKKKNIKWETTKKTNIYFIILPQIMFNWINLVSSCFILHLRDISCYTLLTRSMMLLMLTWLFQITIIYIKKSEWYQFKLANIFQFNTINNTHSPFN